MTKKTLDDVPATELRGCRVVVRGDLNVPLEDGEVGDDTRLRATLPTLRELSAAGARITLLSHLGRPGGSPDPALSLAPVAERLSGLLDRPVAFVADTAGEEARRESDGLEPGAILLLENTRFLGGEMTDDPELARAFAAFGTLFVNDAFGAAHRSHASTAGVARAIREAGGEAVAGRLMERELAALGRVVHDPETPFVAVLGGAKISGKIDVIEALLPEVDRLLVGGAMANTFFQAMGLEVGGSLVEEDRTSMARQTMETAGERLVLPVDCLVAPELSAEAEPRAVGRDEVGASQRVGDIGPRSIAAFRRELDGARTVLWNGPMGVFELEPFRRGTVAVAEMVARAADRGALTVVGGGDSAAAVQLAGVAEKVGHVSTGGGASLAFLAGSQLPGVSALSDR